MNCKYATPIENKPEYQTCLKKLYGGTPHSSVCNQCLKREPRELVAPIIKVVINSPARVRSPVIKKEKDLKTTRLEICRSCIFRKTARCTICGCFTSLIAKDPNKKCPKGKW